MIGLTTPSSFTHQCEQMIEEYFGTRAEHLSWGSLLKKLKRCSGVILAGGRDIHPAMYGQGITDRIGRTDIERDKREFEILSLCFKMGIPVLGICRGFQVIGVHYGFCLIDDLSTHKVDHHPERHNQGLFLKYGEPVHAIYPTTPSAIFFDPSLHVTNSFHHQGFHYNNNKDINTHKGNIEITACALHAQNNIIEAMQGDGWTACQWHPEFDWWTKSDAGATSRVVLQEFKRLMGAKTTAIGK